MLLTKVTGHNFARRVVVLLALSLVVACGGKNEDRADKPTGDADDPGAAAALQGNWNSSCHDASGIGFGLTESSILRITGARFVRETHISTRGNCEMTAVDVIQTGKYQAGPEVKPSVLEIDLRFERVSIVPRTETGVAILQLYNLCGVSDWAIGVEVDVTAQTGSERCFVRLPIESMNIYSIEDGKLFFGNVWDLNIPSRRPEEVDRDYHYAK